jgi:hypothetical protein
MQLVPLQCDALSEAAQAGSADDVAEAKRAAEALGLIDEVMAAEVAISMRLEDALEVGLSRPGDRLGLRGHSLYWLSSIEPCFDAQQ